MKFKILFLSLLLVGSGLVLGQSVKPTNTYPSNLEENQYFEGYDAGSQTIKGIHFLVLSDGDNSLDRTPEFTVKLYLYQEGKEPIFIKTYTLENGIAHLSRRDFKNENVSIKSLNVEPGIYRLGVYINADKSFEEDMNDNAMLFRDPINIKKSSSNEPGGIYEVVKPKKKKDDDDIEDDAPEEEEEDFDDEGGDFNNEGGGF
jgi:hypothetical protein